MNKFCFLRKFKSHIIFFFCLVVSATASNLTLAQSLSCPGFVFERNLQVGDRGNDVFMLQKILNQDSRTTVATSGPGSKGRETIIFGDKTRAALKKLQALFIEETKVANGKLDVTTKNVVNTICQNSTGLEINNTLKFNFFEDKTPPSITLNAPFTIFKDEHFQATFIASENIQTPTLDSVAILGGEISNLQKISARMYAFQVIPSTTTNINQINLKIKSESIKDLFGNLNQDPSNEMLIEVLDLSSSTLSSTSIPTTLNPFNSSSSTTTLSSTTPLSSLSRKFNISQFLQALPSAIVPECNRFDINIFDSFNSCYGKAPSIHPFPSKSENIFDKQADLLPILTGIFSNYSTTSLLILTENSLPQLLNSLGMSESDIKLVEAKGYGSIIGECKCKDSIFFGHKTIGLYKVGGIPYGRFIMSSNPSSTGGPFAGKILEAEKIICGKVMQNGKCISPELDSLGMQAVVGILPSFPIFSWVK